MQNRTANTPDNTPHYKDRSLISGLSSITGTFTGVMGGRFLPLSSSPVITALSTAAIVGTYLASSSSAHTNTQMSAGQRAHQIKENIVKSEIGAASAGASSLASWNDVIYGVFDF